MSKKTIFYVKCIALLAFYLHFTCTRASVNPLLTPALSKKKKKNTVKSQVKSLYYKLYRKWSYFDKITQCDSLFVNYTRNGCLLNNIFVQQTPVPVCLTLQLLNFLKCTYPSCCLHSIIYHLAG